jgi:phosphoribosylformylglycinamidine cyclo-ligase
VEGIAQDALIMNIDDLLCVVQPIIFYFRQQSVNKNLITADVLSAIINGTEELIKELSIIWSIHSTGGNG